MQGNTQVRRTTGGGALLAAIALAAAGPAAAAVDFAGKTIEYVIPFSPGGGSDAWARFNLPYFQKYLPGKPTVVIKNVPGGGSTTGTSQFAASAKPDGLTILGTSASTQFPFLLGDKRARYDYKDFRLILAAPTGGVVYVQSKLGVKSVKDFGKLKGQQLTYGSQGATSLDLVPMLGFRALGLDVKYVFGMKGRSDGRLAFERGEATIDYQTSGAYIKSSMPLVQSGQAVALFSWGATDDDGRIIRDPNFPELPHIGEAIEMATGKKPAGLEWEVLKSFVLAGFGAQKMLFLPKGTSDEIVDAYRAAVRAMRKDPEYQKGRRVAIGDYEQLTDKPGEELLKQGTTITPEARAWIRNFLTTNYNVKF